MLIFQASLAYGPFFTPRDSYFSAVSFFTSFLVVIILASFLRLSSFSLASRRVFEGWFLYFVSDPSRKNMLDRNAFVFFRVLICCPVVIDFNGLLPVTAESLTTVSLQRGPKFTGRKTTAFYLNPCSRNVMVQKLLSHKCEFSKLLFTDA